MEQVRCAYTNALVDKDKATLGFTIRHEVMDLIKKHIPSFTDDDWISNAVLRKYKHDYAETLTSKYHPMAIHVSKHAIISDDLLKEDYKNVDFVDKLGAFAGSHRFTLCLLSFVAIWVCINYRDGFDIYPFNLLDLILGIIASVQALFIMMGQNRSAEHDKKRMRATLQISLKNELELNIIREKIDHIKDEQMPQIYEALKGQVDRGGR